MIQFHFFNNEFFTGRVIYPRFGIRIDDDIESTYDNIVNEYVKYIDNKYGKEHIYELNEFFDSYFLDVNVWPPISRNSRHIEDIYSWEYDSAKISISKSEYIHIIFYNKKLRQ